MKNKKKRCTLCGRTITRGDICARCLQDVELDLRVQNTDHMWK